MNENPYDANPDFSKELTPRSYALWENMHDEIVKKSDLISLRVRERINSEIIGLSISESTCCHPNVEEHERDFLVPRMKERHKLLEEEVDNILQKILEIKKNPYDTKVNPQAFKLWNLVDDDLFSKQIQEFLKKEIEKLVINEASQAEQFKILERKIDRMLERMMETV
jgi:hypothetical protein